jgi:mevalonate kinase
MDKKVLVSAPGKLILSGEHSVVYGYPALLTAVDRRVYVEISKKDKPGFLIDDNSFGTDELFMREICEFSEKAYDAWKEFDKTNDISRLSFIKEDCFGLVKLALSAVLEKVSGRNDGLILRIRSDVPVGSGMGSSAALLVAVIAGLLEFLEKSQEKEKIRDLAFGLENMIHGRSSGVDPAVATYGGLILYKKGSKVKPIKSRGRLPNIFVLQTGKPVESTGEMVVLVNSKLQMKDLKLEIGKVLSDIGKLTGEFIKVFKNGNFDRIGELVLENERLLEKLGVVSVKTKNLLTDLKNIGVAAKISGAGGVSRNSGILLALVENESDIARFLSKRKLENFRVKVDQEGVKIEKN